MPILTHSVILKATHVSKTFGKLQALRDVSISIPTGSTYALLGPNGSGKTTLLKSLMGSVIFDQGVVNLGGEHRVQSKEYKRKFTYMPQFPGFLPHLSARECIQLLVQTRNQEAVHGPRIISDLGISEFWQKPFMALSGGMKQKINILQCFMFEFEFAFLDEPTSSLDPQVSSYLKSLISSLKREGKTILFTSHIMSEVEEIADTMALMNNGEILLEMPPSAFVHKQKARNLEEGLLHYWGQQKHRDDAHAV